LYDPKDLIHFVESFIFNKEYKHFGRNLLDILRKKEKLLLRSLKLLCPRRGEDHKHELLLGNLTNYTLEFGTCWCFWERTISLISQLLRKNSFLNWSRGFSKGFSLLERSQRFSATIPHKMRGSPSSR
jgi:hypothetical protein